MNERNNTGTRNKVSVVATNSPKTMLVATGPRKSDLPPSPAANENRPAMVVRDVIRLGMTRRLAAYMMA